MTQMTLSQIKSAAKFLKISVRAYDIYTALDGRPAYSDDLVARGFCQGEKIDVLQACQELSKRGLIVRSEELDGRWIRVAK